MSSCAIGGDEVGKSAGEPLAGGWSKSEISRAVRGSGQSNTLERPSSALTWVSLIVKGVGSTPKGDRTSGAFNTDYSRKSLMSLCQVSPCSLISKDRAGTQQEFQELEKKLLPVAC